MTWVKPELVCQVKYANWTPDHRLRAPVFLGLRDDVPPAPRYRANRQTTAAERKEFLSADVKEASLRIGGQTLKFTNLNKVFYPDEGYTKRDVLNYYAAVAGLILPHLKDRPLSLKRYPNGIEGVFLPEERAPKDSPPWLRTESIHPNTPADPSPTPSPQDRASLLYLVNLGCIDQNPWMSRLPYPRQSRFHPDRSRPAGLPVR